MPPASFEHWDQVYSSQPADQVSWFQADPEPSLGYITRVARTDQTVVDIGAGASLLVDRLDALGYQHLTVVDLSTEALTRVSERLPTPSRVTLTQADVLDWRPDRPVDVWHDRAVFHFFAHPSQREHYVSTAREAIRPGGHLILATFALDGPQRCSGLDVARYDADALIEQFAPHFTPIHSSRTEHHTPWGAVQPFTWVVLRRTGSSGPGHPASR